MIIFLSGKNGNGKSNWLVSNVEKQYPNRTIYYHGIEGLSLDWKPLEDTKKWYELPVGSVIVIDECHKTFGARQGKVDVPEYIKQLTIHRERGFDIIFSTTMPENVDAYLRRHVNRHLHFRRILGTESANLYEWDYCKKGVDDLTTIDTNDAIKTLFLFDKSVYGKYHSAQQHTTKKRIPWVFYAIPVLIAVVVFAGYKAVNVLTNRGSTIVEQSTGILPIKRSQTNGALEDYIEMNTPLLKDFPHTAPFYDELTQPNAVPYPAACVEIRNTCTCYTQQATKLSTSKTTCIQIVQNGYFLNFQANPNNNNKGNDRLQVLPTQSTKPRTTQASWGPDSTKGSPVY